MEINYSPTMFKISGDECISQQLSGHSMPLVPMVRRQHWPLAATQRGPTHSSMAIISPIPATPAVPARINNNNNSNNNNNNNNRPARPAAPRTGAMAPRPATLPARLLAASRANPPVRTRQLGDFFVRVEII